MFFRLNSLELGLIVFGILLGTTLLGAFAGRHLRTRTELREPFGVLQAALLGLVALILAFGLTMAVDADSRRAAVVDEANAIGTTYLRAQTLKSPCAPVAEIWSGTRTQHRALEAVPGSGAALGNHEREPPTALPLATRGRVARRLPRTARRLYVESLTG
jgi:hypothetical protein